MKKGKSKKKARKSKKKQINTRALSRAILPGAGGVAIELIKGARNGPETMSKLPYTQRHPEAGTWEHRAQDCCADRPDATKGHPDKRDPGVDSPQLGGSDRENDRTERPEAATDRYICTVRVR